MLFDMANIHITRRILISAGIAFFFIFLIFLQPRGPLSPAVRAPGHIDHSAPSVVIKDEMLHGEVIMPKLGNETARAELGRATWKYFHTVLARYPEEPTDDQQETLRSYIYLFARLYPCAECASHFQQHLKRYPPQVSSRNAAAGWGCFVHNEVNKMLKKPMFDCNHIGDFYDCGCAEEDKKKNKGAGASDGDSTSSGDSGTETEHAVPEVEISKEPTTRG